MNGVAGRIIPPPEDVLTPGTYAYVTLQAKGTLLM